MEFDEWLLRNHSSNSKDNPGDPRKYLRIRQVCQCYNYLMITEAERQLLIAYIELEEPVETENNHHYTFYPKTLEAACTYFRGLREDWTDAYPRLEQAGLITRGGALGWTLSPAGRVEARAQRRDHPPIYYWYRELYPMMVRSAAYTRYCEQLYGIDLSQAGFSDLAQIDALIEVGNIQPGMRLIDLGCGLGRVVEYISDRCAATGVGLDYSPEAIQLALARTAAKRQRLEYHLGQLDALQSDAGWLAPGSFDRVISIDTLYMPSSLEDTLHKMRALLAPGGQMLIYYSYFLFNPADPRSLSTADGTPLAQVLRRLGWDYQTWDYSAATFHLMRAKHRLALAMRPEFEAEGLNDLAHHLEEESDGGDSPFDPATNPFGRYLYRVTF